MKKKWIWLLFAIAIAVLFIPREHPESYIGQTRPQNSDWGNLKVIRIDKLSQYTILEVQYEAKNTLTVDERWFIKDRTKIQDIPGGYFSKWHGYIYLAKRGLYSWEVIQ